MRALVVFFLFTATTSAAGQYDLIIRGGRVLDGSGSPAVRADVAIRGDRIVAVGPLAGATATRVVDASGMYVAPGFIDMHSHADRAFAGSSVEARRAPNLVAQGITTVVFGPDGRNPRFPLTDEISAYRTPGVALNVVPMVGHGTVRSRVMSDDYERAATADEIREMQRLVRAGMETGAWGLGAGPEYRPGRFSETDELVALAEVVADYDGFYYAHQRSQSPLPLWQTPSILDGWRLTGTDGMQETIHIGERTGIRVVGSHIKAKGPTSWGQSAVDILMIKRARDRGVQVYLDQYPYETFGGGPTAVLPRWTYAPKGADRTGGSDDPDWNRPGVMTTDHLRANWADPLVRTEIIMDAEYVLDLQGGADRHVIVVSPDDPSLLGRTLTDVANQRGVDPVALLVQFALETKSNLQSGVLFRPVAGHPFDVDNYMQQEFTATSTDGGVSLNARPGQHPRYYGAYPRKLAYYARDRGVITLPFAIRSSTSLPAQIIGLTDRGLVRPGLAADLLIFDFDGIRDRATIMDPDAYPEGIAYVMVNGQFTLDGGDLTGVLPGTVLLKTER